jgi:hypothetical protein
VLAAAAGVATLDRRADSGDLVYFVHQGERLLSGGWADTFADPTLQSGPLQLVVTGAVRSTEALAFFLELGVAALLLVVLGRLGVSRRWQLLIGLAAVATGLTHGAFVDGHPAEVVTPLLWTLAALEARQGATRRAGTLVAASAGFELWGVLGGVVLLLAPKLRDAGRGLVVEGALVAGMFAPFAVFGEFRMFDYEWRVASGTLLSLVVPVGTHFGWPLRLAQAGLACGLGGLLAWRMRRSPHAVWLVPLTVVVARILLDPLAYGWYWLAAQALALVGAALLVTAPPLRVRPAPRPRAAARPREAAPAPPVHS